MFRISLAASTGTGLKTASQVMVDKVMVDKVMVDKVMVDKMMAIQRERIASMIGHVDSAGVREVDRALQLWPAVG